METLTRAVTTAVVCISASIAWASFWSTAKDKWQDRVKAKRAAMKKLLSELEVIKLWAGSEYGEACHSDDWYNPNWQVTPIPSEEIKKFNWVEDTELFGGEIFGLLSPLEASLARFASLLNRQHEFLHSKQRDFISGIIIKLYDEMGTKRVNRIDPRTIVGANALTKEELAYVEGLYAVQKEIHMRGIGTSGDEDSLHHKFTTAYDFVHKYLESVRKPKAPCWSIMGHIAAVIFGVIGLGFLIASAVILF